MAQRDKRPPKREQQDRRHAETQPFRREPVDGSRSTTSRWRRAADAPRRPR